MGWFRATLQVKFIVFIVLIHAVAVGLSFFIFRERKLYFLVSEVLIILSMLICRSLYKDLVQPLRRLKTGLDAIRDRDFNVKFQPTGKPETDGLIEVYNAMIDRLRDERTQQEAQHYFLEKLIFTAPTGILILDFDDRIVHVNPKAGELLKIPFQNSLKDDVDLNAVESNHPLLNFVSALATGENQTVHLGGKVFRCSKAAFIDRGFPRRFIILEELTTEIAAAEKETYSKVIRLMAHEVNNTVGAVNSILDTTLRMNETGVSTAAALQIAFDRNERMNQFMRRYAGLVRTPEPKLERILLIDLIHKTAQLLSYQARESAVDFHFDVADPAQTILADRGLMEQALINIVKNAVESIGQNGTVIFRTAVKPAFLEIEDDGKGVDQEIQDKIFTPFFSSKTYGQGIGLTLVKEILRSHGFEFSLTTLPDLCEGGRKRTIFSIKF